MMKNQTWFMNTLVLLIVAALAYLPLIHQIGYSHDDWYLMWSASANGASVFHSIYSVDRPLRAYVLEMEYAMFGENVLLYNLSAWVFRVLSALLFLWWLRMLWPNQPRSTFLMALFYLVYPGFLSQQNGIDYQSQILSLFLAMLSLGLTVHAFLEGRVWLKFAEMICSISLGIIYLGLVEYEAGFELIRLMLLFLLTGHVAQNNRDRILLAIKSWLPYSLIIGGFGAWRLFIFKSERTATDAGIQFEQFWLYPIQTIYHWAIQVVQDLFDVTFAAWTISFYQMTGHIQKWGSIIAVIVVVLVFLAIMRQSYNNPPDETTSGRFSDEALWIGFLGAVAGLIPIAMVNREVTFPTFSRYSLVSSVGVAIFIVAILIQIRGRFLSNSILAGLIFIAVLTHHANSVRLTEETAVVRNFWWQVSWRVPQFASRTTLIGNYPVGAIEEDYFIWGPANLIYYPDKHIAEGIQPSIFAAVLNKDTVAKILTRERQEFDNRKNIITYKNYRNIVIISQPTLNSCVHVINGLQLEFSQRESDSIRVIGPFSEIEHVLVDDAPHTPQTIVFGPEPPHNWCYYYEKADLARQRGNWYEVIDLATEAFDKGLTPGDPIEWMPFLQAYASVGDVNRLIELATVNNFDPYVSMQACQILRSQELSDPVIEVVDSLYCT